MVQNDLTHKQIKDLFCTENTQKIIKKKKKLLLFFLYDSKLPLLTREQIKHLFCKKAKILRKL